MDNDFEHYYNATVKLKAEVKALEKQLKLADKNYLDLKNSFDESIDEAKFYAWQLGIKWVGTMFTKNMTLKEIMETEFWESMTKARYIPVDSDIQP